RELRREPRRVEGEPSPPPRARRSPEIRDVDEAAVEIEDPQFGERRVAWIDELRLMERGNAHRVVIQGPPGAGKSLLAVMMARRIAESALTALREARAPLSALPFPIV